VVGDEDHHGVVEDAAPAQPSAPRPVPAPVESADDPLAEEHYEPPPAPPVPMPSPSTLYAVLLAAAGVVLVGAPSVLRLTTETGLVLGVAALVGSAALALSRMRDRDDDGDDGAVV
jgi:hypothetical protein